MDEFVTYILYSEHYKKIYIGFTSNLIQRFYSHNKIASKGYTKRYRPWIVIYVKFYRSKKEAMSKEKYLKSGVGRQFIYNIIIPNYTK